MMQHKINKDNLSVMPTFKWQIPSIFPDEIDNYEDIIIALKGMTDSPFYTNLNENITKMIGAFNSGDLLSEKQKKNQRK